MNRFQFVQDNQHTFGVKRLCQVLQIARSSFYAWVARAGKRAERQARDAALAEQIPAQWLWCPQPTTTVSKPLIWLPT